LAEFNGIEVTVFNRIKEVPEVMMLSGAVAMTSPESSHASMQFYLEEAENEKVESSIDDNRHSADAADCSGRNR